MIFCSLFYPLSLLVCVAATPQLMRILHVYSLHIQTLGRYPVTISINGRTYNCLNYGTAAERFRECILGSDRLINPPSSRSHANIIEFVILDDKPEHSPWHTKDQFVAAVQEWFGADVSSPFLCDGYVATLVFSTGITASLRQFLELWEDITHFRSHPFPLSHVHYLGPVSSHGLLANTGLPVHVSDFHRYIGFGSGVFYMYVNRTWHKDLGMLTPAINSSQDLTTFARSGRTPKYDEYFYDEHMYRLFGVDGGGFVTASGNGEYRTNPGYEMLALQVLHVCLNHTSIVERFQHRVLSRESARIADARDLVAQAIAANPRLGTGFD
ncbi:P8 [Sclerotinia sclerotiorum mycoreovirus 4]|uniref:P8 n=1 Tax=Sclerotinia sclerotiorum mycoreovirus 4 TaxID=1840528 RepID=UPI0007C1E436|nr:P8 [Sclerotinia sclerotiorum mycoreovirus 4]ANC52166.1 P8 [Sclerotinia sclerotiorum mycoreovirus 4]